MRRGSPFCALGLLGLLLFACAKESPPLLDPDPGLEGLALSDLSPKTLLPGTTIILSGQGLPSPGDGPISLLLSGSMKPPGGVARHFEVRLRAEYKSATLAQATANSDLFAALGGSDGQLDTHATLVVDSAVDLTSHQSAPLRVELQVASSLQPRLDDVELFAADKTKVHSNDWVTVRGDNLLFGDAEGQTLAVLDGCFLRTGLPDDCAAAGQLVRGIEVPVSGVSADRRSGVFAYTPSIHGILPGRFVGTVALKNQQTTQLAATRSDPRPLSVALVEPELRGFSPSAASLGQYVELLGAGFVGEKPNQATLVKLAGQFVLEGAPLMIPVDLELVVKWLPRYPNGPVGLYVLDETDALGQALSPRGGLRQAAGTFTGSATLVLRDGPDSVASQPIAATLTLRHVKQLVLVRFLPAYQEGLRLYGLRVVDRAVRARVLDVARRDYAGVNIEFREVEPNDPPPTDFALYSVVEIGGSDPNGLAYLGYDNTPGRDIQNQRLYDRIGGVNAVTQSDGAPGYGGVFTEQLLGFSTHPGNVEPINVLPEESALFDRIFDPLRPDRGGDPATSSWATQIPPISDGNICPAEITDRPRQIACAIFVLGNLIGTTMTHELGHSLGLANPDNPEGSYHNNGRVTGRIMNIGALRSFRERSELSSSGPALFCDSDYAYLQRILPGGDPPRFPLSRPPCLD